MDDVVELPLVEIPVKEAVVAEFNLINVIVSLLIERVRGDAPVEEIPTNEPVVVFKLILETLLPLMVTAIFDELELRIPLYVVAFVELISPTLLSFIVSVDPTTCEFPEPVITVIPVMELDAPVVPQFVMVLLLIVITSFQLATLYGHPATIILF